MTTDIQTRNIADSDLMADQNFHTSVQCC